MRGIEKREEINTQKIKSLDFLLSLSAYLFWVRAQTEQNKKEKEKETLIPYFRFESVWKVEV